MNSVLLVGDSDFTASVVAQVRGLDALTVTLATTVQQATDLMAELIPDVVISQACQLVEGSVFKTFNQERHSVYFIIIEETDLLSREAEQSFKSEEPRNTKGSDAQANCLVDIQLEKTASALESGADAYLWLPSVYPSDNVAILGIGADNWASASVAENRAQAYAQSVKANIETNVEQNVEPETNTNKSNAVEAAFTLEADFNTVLSVREAQKAASKADSSSGGPDQASADVNESAIAEPSEANSIVWFRQNQRRLIQAHIQIGLNCAQRYRDLSRINDWLSAVALVDALTQLSNRRAFDMELPRQIKMARSKNMPLSLMVLDIDYFKSVNDCYGHLVGDEVLKMLAKRLLTNMRFYDTPFRYGGEEFVITLSNTDLKEGESIAERLRQSIAQNPFELDHIIKGINPLELSVSIGITDLRPEDDASGRSFLNRADQNLLTAKSTGRNRIVID
jgi:diguanylate cyclase (GGDEF)-like protein